jgi:hypothetical protein
MLLEQNDLQSETLVSQVERILRSEELRTSDVLRQILRFLLEKSISGEADQLKEYTVAIEGLGKSVNYDPQHNSAVRIQVSRLRQKLAEYYRGSGKDDLVIVEIPKGRFKLSCEIRQATSVPDISPMDHSHAAGDLSGSSLARSGVFMDHPLRLSLILGVVLLAFFLGRWSTGSSKASEAKWAPDYQAVWGPFVDSDRPLLISIEDPLFVEMRSYPGAFFRDRTLNSWQEVLSSPTIDALRSLFKHNDIQPSRYYTTFGEANAAFLIGNLLGPHARAVSFERSSEVSLQQLSDDNLIFVGVQNLFFDEKINALPISMQLAPVLSGVRNLHPLAGEPDLFNDKYSTAPTQEGFVYALITRLPGPRGNGNVESFTSNCSAGYLGAVQWLLDPASTRFLASQLKDPATGRLPKYFQVLLKVKFKDEVPTEATYVLSRELR